MPASAGAAWPCYEPRTECGGSVAIVSLCTLAPTEVLRGATGHPKAAGMLTPCIQGILDAQLDSRVLTFSQMWVGIDSGRWTPSGAITVGA
jgi:hypothetical protein